MSATEQEQKTLKLVKAVNSLLQSDLQRELEEQERNRQRLIAKHRCEVREVKHELVQIKRPPCTNTAACRKANQVFNHQRNEILSDRKWRSHLNKMADNQARAALHPSYKRLLPERGQLLDEVHEDFAERAASTGYSNFTLLSKKTTKHETGFSKVGFR